ncbi:unnamed protein product [Caenorhabditis angaria]|uniref:Uncharacterized protein n=1 Tax=Caenorhabditis angaria TaxID=860376 RepID=A0A9P1MWR3_9PELO|nr:unnamed protein product [Caenorhabditis angaria]
MSWLNDLPDDLHKKIINSLEGDITKFVDPKHKNDESVKQRFRYLIEKVIWDEGTENQKQFTRILIKINSEIEYEIRFLKKPSIYRKTIIERRLNTSLLGDRTTNDSKYLKTASEWFVDLILTPKFDFDCIVMNKYSKADHCPDSKLCNVRELDISTLENTENTFMSWWLTKFASPIEKLTISSGRVKSIGVGNLDQVREARNLTVHGLTDVVDKTYWLVQAEDFCHRDYASPAEVTSHGIKLLFENWIKNTDKPRKYRGRLIFADFKILDEVIKYFEQNLDTVNKHPPIDGVQCVEGLKNDYRLVFETKGHLMWAKKTYIEEKFTRDAKKGQFESDEDVFNMIDTSEQGTTKNTKKHI